MPIDKTTPDENLDGENVEVEKDDDDDGVTDTEDGGAMVKLDDDRDLRANLKHFANIVDDVDRSELSDLVTDLLDKLEKDKQSREKRDKLYEEGIRRTGLGDDAPGGAAFSGANKVVHPMLVSACVDFSARVMKEIFPSGGPVKSKIIGLATKEKVEKSERKTTFMNWQATEQMPEFRGELEQLSTQLPLGGVQYMKVMWNAHMRRPMVEFVPVDDIYLPFAATNFYTAERKTHVQYVTKQKYLERIKSGMYKEVDLTEPDMPEFSKASIANDKIEGRQDSSYNEDGLRTVFEVSVHCDIEGEDVKPYIITIDKSSQKALCVYRNWEPDDDRCIELGWTVEFPFVPWRGAYPIGLTHMIGGLSGAATGAMRALLDSAHIQNIPTMLKLKGGPNGQTLNLQPTEVVEIEGGAMIDDIRKIAMPIPFNPPSAVLFQLLGFLVDAGSRVVQTSFEKLSEGNQNMPVGTTVALIEQGMVVFSSIHSRLHNSMSTLFKIIHRINSAYLTEEDVKQQAGDLEIKPSDFDGPLDIVPVSDPAIFSETQRFAQTQAIMQRAASMPQMYDTRKVEEMFLRSMKVPNDILTAKAGEDDVDPVSENVAAAMSRPVYVLPSQDHVTHLKLHMAFLSSQALGSNPVIARTFLYPMVTHLRDHLLNYYMVEAHSAVKQAVEGKIIKDDSKEEALVVAQVQRIVEQELAGFVKMLPAIDQEAQKYKPQQPMPQDSSMEIAQLRSQVEQARMQQDGQFKQANMQQQGQFKQAEMQQRGQFEQAKMQQQGEFKQADMQLEQAKMGQTAQLKQADMQQEGQFKQADLASRQQSDMVAMRQEELRQAQENLRLAEDLAARERMNSADNNTAMRLAMAEIASGEKFSVSTGTGINPGS